MVTFNEAMLSNDRTLAIRVGDFTSENIKSANFKYGYITGDDFTPGGTYAGTASILFTSIVESFKKLDVVYPEIGLLVGSKVEWVKMGKYYIDDIKIDRNANTTEIELMDEMFKLNESFKTDLKYPAQIRDVILEIATKTGVTLATDNFGTTAIQQHVDEPTGDKLTYRDVLSQASQLLGFSCFFNRNGELEVRGLTESGITITADNYFLHGLEKSEVEYQIAGITCEVANDEKLTVGLQTGRSLEIENPLATQDTLNLLYYALKDIVYYPYDLSYQGHLKLDVGQWVTIKTNKGETFKVPVLYQSFSFSGGLTSTISADSVAGSDAQYTYGSFVTKKIDQKSTRIQAEVQQQLKYADEEFKKVSNEMLQQSLEYQNSVRNELTTSKAELETQINTAKTQAETNAKAYADEINQATAEVAEQANTAANSLKSDLTQVKKDLTTATNTANSAKTSASEAKQQLTAVANDLNTAKQDLQAQASQLTAQASAQSELTKRVSSVEETANGTKTTVSELSKTVDGNTQDIASVTARTKTVEDDLTSTKTTLSQVQTTANSASQKTATLETGLNGLNARFENLQIGTVNLLHNSKGPFKPNANKIDNWQRFENTYVYLENGKQYVLSGETDGVFSNVHNVFEESDRVVLWLVDPDKSFNKIVSDDKTGTSGTAFIWNSASGTYQLRVNTYHTVPTKSAWNIQIEEGNLRSTYSQNEADIESKVAEYKQTADQNYASLQSNLQTLDGTVKQNKSEFDQTASQIKSSISAVEGKIPTEIGGRNLIVKSTSQLGLRLGMDAGPFNDTTHSLSDWIAVEPNTTYTLTCYENIDEVGKYYSLGWYSSNAADYSGKISRPTGAMTSSGLKGGKQYQAPANAKYAKVSYPNNYSKVKLERGTVATDYSLAPEDYDSDITKLNTTLTQTANGLEQLSTQVTSQGNTITSHTNSINSLNTGLSAKVSQTDFNTLSGRVNTAENNITAKANELSSKISSLNVGNKNYLPTSRVINRGCTNFSYNETSKSWTMTVPASSTTFGNGITFNTSGLNILLNGGETLFFGLMIKANKACSFNYDINNALSGTTSNDNDDRSKQAWSPSNKSIPANVWTRVWFSYTAKANVPIKEANSNFGIVNNTEAINIEIKEVMVAKSNVPVDYQTPDADFEAKNTELKQTTDAINASVSALDSSTVKSASLTINADGIVMKAGKSTTDVANAIGAYFAVNQNAINLFSDKINVKANMIVDGAITSTKIASKTINTAHLNGKIITADVISSNAVTADAIKAGAVTTDKMTANSINGDRITAGTLDAAKIKAGSITASQIASGTITSDQIKASTITSANIATGAITTNKIAANSINSDKIVSSGITADVIKGGQLTATNNATIFDLTNGNIIFNSGNPVIKRESAGYEKGEFSINNRVMSLTTGGVTTKYNMTSINIATTNYKPSLTGNDKQAYIQLTSNKTTNKHYVKIKANEILLAFNDQLTVGSLQYTDLGFLLHELVASVLGETSYDNHMSLRRFYNYLPQAPTQKIDSIAYYT